MDSEINQYNTLDQLYADIGTPIEQESSFTIHNLKDLHNELPYTSPVFRTDYYSFVFVKNGSGSYTTDGHTFPTQPGTIYFTNPGHLKAFHMEKLEEVYLITLNEGFLKENVHPDIFNEFPFLLAEMVKPKTLAEDDFREFETIYLQILKESKSDSSFKYRIIGNLFVVILLKIKEQFWSDYNPIDDGERSSEIVKKFKLSLEGHYRELANGNREFFYQVQDYANEQHLHPNYLSTVIKNKTGKSVNNWIAEKTISEAQALLANTSLLVKEIAFRLGFSEPTHFNSYYKKHTGLTPNAFRKSRKSNS